MHSGTQRHAGIDEVTWGYLSGRFHPLRQRAANKPMLDKAKLASYPSRFRAANDSGPYSRAGFPSGIIRSNCNDIENIGWPLRKDDTQIEKC